jgi:uncharacterized protein YjbI with pentapeptide repeats
MTTIRFSLKQQRKMVSAQIILKQVLSHLASQPANQGQNSRWLVGVDGEQMSKSGWEVEGKLLRGEDFSGESFAGGTLRDCVCESCNFSNADFTDTKLQTVVFRECKLLGVDFSKCSKFLFKIEFENCTISQTVFSRLDLGGMSFAGSRIIECDFLDTNLRKCSFENADLSGSVFRNADLREASFVGAKAYAISPGANRLKGAKFSFPEALSLLHEFGVEIVY